MSNPDQQAIKLSRYPSDRAVTHQIEPLPSDRAVTHQIQALSDRAVTGANAQYGMYAPNMVCQGNGKLPVDYQFGRYLMRSSAENLRGLVSIEPAQLAMVWLPLLAAETPLLYVSDFMHAYTFAYTLATVT